MPNSVLLAGVVLLCACDGVYETAPGGESALYVVNRFTGGITHVRAEDMHVATPKPTIVRKLDAITEVPESRTQVRVKAKIVGNTVYYALTILPAESAKNDVDRWRKYVSSARFVARVIPKFFDADGFTILDDSAELSKFTQVVDDKGALSALEYQSRLSSLPEQLDLIVIARSGWSAWPPFPADPKAKDEP